MDFEFLKTLIVPTETRIIILIMNGPGGLPIESLGKSELEASRMASRNLVNLPAHVAAWGCCLPSMSYPWRWPTPAE